MESQPTELKRRNERAIQLAIWVGIIVSFVLVVIGFVEWRVGHGMFFERVPTAQRVTDLQGGATNSHAVGSPQAVTNPEGSQLNDWGNYGSYLQGTTGSLWALASFVLIFVAFLAQKQQLLRQEAELEDQARQFKQQHDSLKRQNFESSFFQLLHLHNQIVADMRDVDATKWTSAEQDLRGRRCFQKWYQSLTTNLWGFQFSGEEGSTGGLTVEKAPKNNVERYEAFYEAYQGTLGHYFRNLYHLFRFVNDSWVDDKRRYTSLARATLSQFELALLFYNGLTTLGEKFKPLIEDFGLLENFNQTLLLRPGDKLLLGAKDGKPYKPEAYR